MSEPTVLSDADAKKVAEQVVILLAPKSNEPVEEPTVELDHQRIDVDPSTTAFYEMEAKLISQLGNPKLITVTNKRGSRIHNLTENALNALYDLGRNRKIFKERMG